MRVLFTGGGTGGHFFPILAITRELKMIAEKERVIDLELFYMSPDSLGKNLIEREGVILVKIIGGKWRRYFSLANFLDIFKVVIGIFQALWNIFIIMPDVIFAKGGYGSLPAVVGAMIFRIPLIIHDSDAIPGKVNLFAAKYAQRIGIAFEGALDYLPLQKTALVGVPIRKNILGGNKEEAKKEFGIVSNLPVIGFIGASQGAEKLNNVVLNSLKELTARYEIIHQTGPKNFNSVDAEAKIVLLEGGEKERYHIYGFFDENKLRAFYAASHLLVSRASATSIYEIAACAKPSILFPLDNAAQDHQRKNAYEYASTGAAVVVEEENLTPHILLSEIDKILRSPERFKKMSEAAQKFSRVDAAEVVAREVFKLGVHS